MKTRSVSGKRTSLYEDGVFTGVKHGSGEIRIRLTVKEPL